jgi:hypothetical protein
LFTIFSLQSINLRSTSNNATSQAQDKRFFDNGISQQCNSESLEPKNGMSTWYSVRDKEMGVEGATRTNHWNGQRVWSRSKTTSRGSTGWAAISASASAFTSSASASGGGGGRRGRFRRHQGTEASTPSPSVAGLAAIGGGGMAAETRAARAAGCSLPARARAEYSILFRKVPSLQCLEARENSLFSEKGKFILYSPSSLNPLDYKFYFIILHPKLLKTDDLTPITVSLFFNEIYKLHFAMKFDRMYTYIITYLPSFLEYFYRCIALSLI